MRSPVDGGLVRVAIVGSRDYADLRRVAEYVKTLPSDTVIVSGGAVGVDTTAAVAARKRGLIVEEYLPNYALYGRHAPIIRNGDIVSHADFIAAFWDGKSRGTKNTIDRAKRLGKRVWISE